MTVSRRWGAVVAGVAAAMTVSCTPSVPVTPQASSTPSSAAPATSRATPGAPPEGRLRGIGYGANTTYSGKKVNLTLDLFLPRSAAGTKRPLLVLLGGAYYHPSLGMKIAAKGVAVAYIDITEFDGPPSAPDAGAWRTVRDVHDAKAAVRFFRKDAATANLYSIDPRKIVLGGHSAKGALSGITTYLDDANKADPTIRRLLADTGGLEGAGGSPGYDSSVAGWISLAGCLRMADLGWITSSSPPLLAVYGTKDKTVPTSEGVISLLGERTTWAGATVLYRRAKSVGLDAAQLYAIPGGDHDSAMDAENPELISRVVGFVATLP